MVSLERTFLTTVNFSAVEPFELSLSSLEREKVHLFSNDSLYSDLLKVNGKPIPLESLNNEIGQLRQIQRSRVYAHNASTFAYWASISLVAFMIFSCACICYARHLLRENRDRLGRPHGRSYAVRFFNSFRDNIPGTTALAGHEEINLNPPQ